MCKPGKHLKLCTCAADQVDKERCWRLFRVDPGPRDVIEGMIVPPELTELSMYLEGKFLEDLNKENVFDFEYEPKDGDVIEITLDDYQFAYEYKDDKFEDAPVDYSFSHRLEVSQGNVRMR